MGSREFIFKSHHENGKCRPIRRSYAFHTKHFHSFALISFLFSRCYRVAANTSDASESDTNTFRTHASNQKYRRRKQNQSRLHTFRVEI